MQFHAASRCLYLFSSDALPERQEVPLLSLLSSSSMPADVLPSELHSFEKLLQEWKTWDSITMIRLQHTIKRCIIRSFEHLQARIRQFILP
jgi:hypothetical protein